MRAMPILHMFFGFGATALARLASGEDFEKLGGLNSSPAGPGSSEVTFAG
jgi:hypothetical protein